MLACEVVAFEEKELVPLQLEELFERVRGEAIALFFTGVRSDELQALGVAQPLGATRYTYFLERPIRNAATRYLTGALALFCDTGHPPVKWRMSGGIESEVDPRRDRGYWLLTRWFPSTLSEWRGHGKAASALEAVLTELREEAWGAFGVDLSRRLRQLMREAEGSFQLFAETLSTRGTVMAFGLPEGVLHLWEPGVRVFKGRDKGRLREKSREMLEFVSPLVDRCTVRGSRPNFDSGSWPLLLAASAGWYLRLALVQRSWGFRSGCVLALVRSLELALISKLIDQGEAEFSPADSGIYVGRNPVEGAGVYVGLVERGIIDLREIGENREEWAKRVGRILRLRNRSRLAHGLLDVDDEGLDYAYTETKSCIEKLLDEPLQRAFDLVFSASSECDLSTRYSSVLKRATAEYWQRGLGSA